MQVTGTIRSVFATQEGGYQGPSGYVYTFDMEIDTPQGIISGQIGSKKQPYPLAARQPITVEVTETDRGPRLKKINPQYANQPPQGAPPPQSGPPPQTPAPAVNSAPPQRVPSEWDKPIDWHDKKQLLIVRQSSISNAIAMVKMGEMDYPSVGETLAIAEKFAYFVYHGVKDELDKALAQGGQPNSDYVGDDPSAPPKDDIPY